MDESTPHESSPDTAGSPGASQETPGRPEIFLILVIGTAFYGTLGLLVAAWFGNDWARARLADVRTVGAVHPYWTIGVVVFVVLLGGSSFWFQHWFRRLPDDTRRTIVGFLAVGLILLSTVAMVFLGVAHRLFAHQIAFFLVASLLPGALYYLFLRTRRPSILNEFTMNLWRLGLLVPRHTYLRQGDQVVRRIESREDLVARVDSYFQKFEAVYGALRFGNAGESKGFTRMNYVDGILQDASSPQRRWLAQPTVRLADILTANIFIPLGFATFLAALGWLLVLEPTWVTSDGAAPAVAVSEVRRLVPIATPLNFAFLGAYFFGLQALFRRFVRRDLGPNAFLAFSNRIVLSLIGVWVIVVCFALTDNPGSDAVAARLTQDRALLVMAFVIGVFPRTLWQVISAAITKITFVKLAVPSVEAKQPLDDLDGLTIWHQSRLEEEDIENVPNMATADMVDLVLHTQISTERLVDWIDQAILYKALGPEAETDFVKTRRGKLRALGIRTATQLVRVYSNAEETDRAALDRALGDDPDPASLVRTIVRAIQIESNWDAVAAWRNVEQPLAIVPAQRRAAA